MPLIVTEGQLSQGHGPQSSPIPTNTKVRIQGKPIIVQGDKYTEHYVGDTLHRPVSLIGSPTVRIGGVPVLRDGDPLSCGDVADTQSQITVFANGGGNAAAILGSQAAAADPGETVGYSIEGITVSYPGISLEGRHTAQNLGSGGGSTPWKLTFREWCPGTLAPKPSNGFIITLKEEFTGNIYESFQGIGAPSLPPAAGQEFKDPLDGLVSFEILPKNEGNQIFDIDSAGNITLKPEWQPYTILNGTSRSIRGGTIGTVAVPGIKVRVSIGAFTNSVIIPVSWVTRLTC